MGSTARRKLEGAAVSSARGGHRVRGGIDMHSGGPVAAGPAQAITQALGPNLSTWPVEDLPIGGGVHGMARIWCMERTSSKKAFGRPLFISAVLRMPFVALMIHVLPILQQPW